MTNFYTGVLEGDPTGRRSLYESYRPDFARTPAQRDVFTSMFDRIMNDFLGTLGSEVRSGPQVPVTSFTDYLNQQDFGRQLRRNQRFNRPSSPLTSAARFIYNR